jgi:DNA polymerase III subunit alpha
VTPTSTSTSRPFVHLHNHSDFSLLDGASRVEEITALAARYGMPAVALTDHGNMFGAVNFFKAAKKHGVKPILGCEIYVAPKSRFDKSPNGSVADTNNHLVLLAESNEGYKNLVKLVTAGYLEGFYYKPRIDKELLATHSKGLIGLSACLKGEVPQAAMRGDDAGALRAAGVYRDILGPGNFFLEIQDHALGLETEKTVNTGLLALARKEGMPTVATNDCHYISRADAEAHDILLCIGTGKKSQDQARMRYPGDQFYFKSSEEMLALFDGYREAYDNTLAIAERVHVDLDRDGFQLPRFQVPEEFTADSYFEKMAWGGFQDRWRTHGSTIEAEGRFTLADYEARLKREIAMIQTMGFPSYFLIVWDFIRFAKDRGIPVGPGRGSAAGSLVAYALRITDIDPLEHDLIFERFLNPERVSMPDIDIDFCEARRGEVIDYVTEKYGRDNVAQIITFGTMKARAVIRDVGRVLDIPYADVDRIAKLIPATLDATLEKALKEVPQLQEAMNEDPRVLQLVESAKRLEGVSRHASTHAAGVVIAPEPLTEFLPLYRGSKGEITTQYDMRNCEDIGLLKMDFLGLRTLTLIDNCVKMIARDLDIRIDLDTLPQNDAKTYQLFSRGDTFGVFQFESDGMRDILRRFKPERLSDLTALNALYRPGPIRSGMIDDFIDRKWGKVSVRYELPALKPVLEDTLGVIVYQEQVMKIASTLAGFTLGEADILRRAMGKKKAEVMQAQRDKFMNGALANKIPEKKAGKIFDLMEHFAGYGFNRSHSAAYALVAYQTGYLKANYPVYFMAALLTSEKMNTDKVVQYMNACRDMGIEVVPPDINESELDFAVVKDKIRFGLAAVKNVGVSAIESMLAARAKVGRFRSITELAEEVDLRLVNKRVLESLVRSGSFDSLGVKRAQLAAVVDRALEWGQQVQRERDSGQGSLFADMTAMRRGPELERYPDLPEWSQQERLGHEKSTLGFFLSGHPLDAYQDVISVYATCDSRTLSAQASTHEMTENGAERGGRDGRDAQEVSIAGLIGSIRTLRTRKGDAMAVLRLEDAHGSSEVVVFPDLYRQSFGILSNDAAVLVKGKPEAGEDMGKVLASKIVPLDEVRQREATSMTLHIPLDSFFEDTLPHLRELLEQHRGSCILKFELARQEYRVVMRPHPFLRVEPSPELVTSLEAMCGEGAVELSR